jgi:hypothetical protein
MLKWISWRQFKANKSQVSTSSHTHSAGDEDGGKWGELKLGSWRQRAKWQLSRQGLYQSILHRLLVIWLTFFPLVSFKEKKLLLYRPKWIHFVKTYGRGSRLWEILFFKSQVPEWLRKNVRSMAPRSKLFHQVWTLSPFRNFVGQLHTEPKQTMGDGAGR